MGPKWRAETIDEWAAKYNRKTERKLHGRVTAQADYNPGVACASLNAQPPLKLNHYSSRFGSASLKFNGCVHSASVRAEVE